MSLHTAEFDAIDRGDSPWVIRRARRADRYGAKNINRILSIQAGRLKNREKS